MLEENKTPIIQSVFEKEPFVILTHYLIIKWQCRPTLNACWLEDWRFGGWASKDSTANIMGLILRFNTDLTTLETTSSMASL